ncbi:MAG TPA: hypothetical protein VGW38_18000, partial [Chloroflexota bacterium]|nr:hypothetical protein [Chloroflexota bacterium]
MIRAPHTSLNAQSIEREALVLVRERAKVRGDGTAPLLHVPDAILRSVPRLRTCQDALALGGVLVALGLKCV